MKLPSRAIRVLACAYDFPPRKGGIATCASQFLSALTKRHDVDLRLLAGVCPETTLQEEGDDSNLGFPVTRLPLSASTPLATIQMMRAIRREAREFLPEAILGFSWLPEGLAAWTLSKMPGSRPIPSFIFAHGVELLESHRNLRKSIRSLLSPVKSAVFRQARGVFAVSQYTRNLVLSRSGAHPDRVRVLSNGTDPDIFIPNPSAGENFKKRYGLQGKQVLLTVSRLEDYKGVDKGIETLSLLKASLPDLRYVIVGNGPDLSRLRSLAAEYNVSDRVVFAGCLPQAEVLEAYQAADLFLLLTREDLVTPNVEGFGIVILEAACCEVAALGGRSGGIPEAIEEGQTGWLVDPTSCTAISLAIQTIFSNPEELKRRGIAARKRVMESFTWDHMVDKALREMINHVRN